MYMGIPAVLLNDKMTWLFGDFVSLVAQKVCDRLRSRIVEASAWCSCSLIVHRFLVQMAGLCALVSRHLITCTVHLSIELWKMSYINSSK